MKSLDDVVDAIKALTDAVKELAAQPARTLAPDVQPCAADGTRAGYPGAPAGPVICDLPMDHAGPHRTGSAWWTEGGPYGARCAAKWRGEVWTGMPEGNCIETRLCEEAPGHGGRHRCGLTGTNWR